MKFLDYLAKRRLYKELLRQLKAAEKDRNDTAHAVVEFESFYDEKMKKIAVETFIKLERRIKSLNEELKEIFK